MNKDILTSEKAEKIQDNIFKKMSADKKIKMVSQFFKFGKKLSKLNGDRRPSYENSRHIKKS